LRECCRRGAGMAARSPEEGRPPVEGGAEGVGGLGAILESPEARSGCRPCPYSPLARSISFDLRRQDRR